MNAAEASFNPRARVGRDIDVAPPGQLYIDPFQSTRPRGARPIHRVTREIDQEVSIHAPAWGATVGKYVQSPLSGFQSTRPRGARQAYQCRDRQYRYCFNPRARVGRDSTQREIVHMVTLFQSTRPRGARLIALSFPFLTQRVSIHAPAWGATLSAICLSILR